MKDYLLLQGELSLIRCLFHARVAVGRDQGGHGRVAASGAPISDEAGGA